jgi:hypothetical protein
MRDLVQRARFGLDGAFNLKALHIGQILMQVSALIVS